MFILSLIKSVWMIVHHWRTYSFRHISFVIRIHEGLINTLFTVYRLLSSLRVVLINHALFAVVINLTNIFNIYSSFWVNLFVKSIWVCVGFYLVSSSELFWSTGRVIRFIKDLVANIGWVLESRISFSIYARLDVFIYYTSLNYRS